MNIVFFFFFFFKPINFYPRKFNHKSNRRKFDLTNNMSI